MTVWHFGGMRGSDNKNYVGIRASGMPVNCFHFMLTIRIIRVTKRNARKA